MQKQGLFAAITSILLLFLSNVTFAQNVTDTPEPFNVEKANKTFDEITIRLSIQDVRVNDLKQAVETLEKLQSEAKDCVNKANEQIKIIDETLKPFKDAEKAAAETTRADIQFLQNKKEVQTKQMTDCRLFSFRVQEAITAYRDKIQDISSSVIFTRGTPIWQLIHPDTLDSVSVINWAAAFAEFSFSDYLRQSLVYLLGLFIVAVVGIVTLRKSTLELATFRLYYRRLFILAVVLLLGSILSSLLQLSTIPTNIKELFNSMIIFTVACVGLWAAWPWTEPSGNEDASTLKEYSHRMLLVTFVAIVLIADWLGFHLITQYLIRDLTQTAVLLIGLYIIFNFTNKCLYKINYENNVVSRFLRYYTGIKRTKVLQELVLVKFVLDVLLFTIVFIALLNIWGFSDNTLDIIKNSLIDGFTFLELEINPLSIVVAILAFSIINLFARVICALIQRQQQFGTAADTQVALASLISYIGFAVALLIALLIAGVNFTGLAIIAGALSVGIGFGLQSIVNNFLSGLILLIEKPIKPGDRILFGNTEGYVKKIRVRSTRITTLAKEDVIVPNADLVVQQVTNYMLHDRFWRVVNKVGVAYGSDINLVKNVLIKVALAHEEVLKESPNMPRVMFKSFGDSTLNFELWSIIRNVNLKNDVESELNFAIDRAFRENNIVIAFPQRDIHIKEHPHTTEK